jgi:predicted alpha/beta hydrolase
MHPTQIDLTIASSDSYALAANVFNPAKTKDRAHTIIINAAMGVKQTFYFKLAQYLAEHGFTVITYDYRGIGDSKRIDIKHLRADYSVWAEDFTSVLLWATQQFPEQIVSVIGHSLGGQLIGLCPHHDKIHTWMGVAAQSGYWRNWSGLGRLRLLALWGFFMPTTTRILGYFPSKVIGMGEDLPPQVALTWAKACMLPRYIRDFYDQAPFNYFEQVRTPMYLLGFSDDGFAPQKAIESLGLFFTKANPTVKIITPLSEGMLRIGHFDFFREKVGKKLWHEIIDWLDKHP